MIVSPGGLRTKYDCAGKDQQQFTQPEPAQAILSFIVSSRYLETTGEQTRIFACRNCCNLYSV
jgi:hypothetical protein